MDPEGLVQNESLFCHPFSTIFIYLQGAHILIQSLILKLNFPGVGFNFFF